MRPVAARMRPPTGRQCTGRPLWRLHRRIPVRPHSAPSPRRPRRLTFPASCASSPRRCAYFACAGHAGAKEFAYGCPDAAHCPPHSARPARQSSHARHSQGRPSAADPRRDHHPAPSRHPDPCDPAQRRAMRSAPGLKPAHGHHHRFPGALARSFATQLHPARAPRVSPRRVDDALHDAQTMLCASCRFSGVSSGCSESARTIRAILVSRSIATMLSVSLSMLKCLSTFSRADRMRTFGIERSGRGPSHLEMAPRTSRRSRYGCSERCCKCRTMSSSIPIRTRPAVLLFSRRSSSSVASLSQQCLSAHQTAAGRAALRRTSSVSPHQWPWHCCPRRRYVRPTVMPAEFFGQRPAADRAAPSTEAEGCRLQTLHRLPRPVRGTLAIARADVAATTRHRPRRHPTRRSPSSDPYDASSAGPNAAVVGHDRRRRGGLVSVAAVPCATPCRSLRAGQPHRPARRSQRSCPLARHCRSQHQSR